MDKPIIRAVSESDLPSIVEIVTENYDTQSAAQAYFEILSAIKGASPQPDYLVAQTNLEIVGVVGSSPSFMNHRIVEIFWVNVKMSHQHRGIGKILVSCALKYALASGAESVMLTATDALIPFYTSLGFAFKGKIGNDRFDDNLMEAKPRLLAIRQDEPAT